MTEPRQLPAEPSREMSAKAARRQRRLTRRDQFDYVKRLGKTAVGRQCVVQAAPPRDGERRSAIVVSRYFSRKAVDRNRVRRIIRVALRDLLTQCPPCWIVVRPRKAICAAKTDQVQQELERLFAKLSLLAESQEQDQQGRPS